MTLNAIRRKILRLGFYEIIKFFNSHNISACDIEEDAEEFNNK